MDNNDDLTFFEIVSGTIVLVGGVLLLLHLLGFIVFPGGWSAILLGFLGVGLFMLIQDGFKTGALGVKGGQVYRDKQPIAFWGFVIFYLFVGIGFSLGGVILFLEGLLEAGWL